MHRGFGSRMTRPTLIWMLLVVVAASIGAVGEAASSEFSAKVIAVLDGDQITVVHDRRQQKIRLNGIDSPEVQQPFGKRAKQFTADRTLGKTVTVVSVGKDRQGRTIADVFLPDGQLLSYLLMKEGLAWWYRQHALDNTVLEQLEREARKARKGLWAESNPVAPWQWRRDKRH